MRFIVAMPFSQQTEFIVVRDNDFVICCICMTEQDGQLGGEAQRFLVIYRQSNLGGGGGVEF